MIKLAVSLEPLCVTRTTESENCGILAMFCDCHSKPNVARILPKWNVSKN